MPILMIAGTATTSIYGSHLPSYSSHEMIFSSASGLIQIYVLIYQNLGISIQCVCMCVCVCLKGERGKGGGGGGGKMEGSKE